MNAGHVQHIQLGNYRLQAGNLGERHVVLLQKGPHVPGHRQLLGGDEEKADLFKLGQGLDEGVDGAAVFQVAAQAHGQPVHPPQQAGDGGQVGHGLGGVHVAAVPGVDHRHVGVEGGRLGRPLPGGAHYHHIGVAGHHLDGVLQALALGRGGGAGVGETEHRPAQAEHGRLEGEIGAGGGLIEHGSHHLAPAGVEILLRMVHDPHRLTVQRLPLRPGHIPKINQMPHGSRSFFRIFSDILP